jgi:hypothetical protein
VAHCPSSNTKLASGIAPVVKMLKSGVKVSLGTDGFAGSNDTADLIGEMSLAAKLQKVTQMDAEALPAEQALEMATMRGPRVLGLDREIGSLETAKRADLIAVSIATPHSVPIYNLYSQLVYVTKANDVRDVIVNGRQVVQDGQTACQFNQIYARTHTGSRWGDRGGRQALAIENAALRLQLAAFQRRRKRQVLTTLDRVFWITLHRLWSDWRRPLIYVQPDTVVRWQRERFRRFWARLSKPPRRRRGRPITAAEIRRLIEELVPANPLWRAPRIHGELKMLGIAISERTASRILRRLPRPPSQTWKTFLHNHLGQMASVDFFTVPTISLKVLFVFVVLEHRRREVLHFGVRAHPTAAWTAQQIVEAFGDREPARYLIRDRDSIYGTEVRLRIASLGT